MKTNKKIAYVTPVVVGSSVFSAYANEESWTWSQFAGNVTGGALGGAAGGA